MKTKKPVRRLTCELSHRVIAIGLSLPIPSKKNSKQIITNRYTGKPVVIPSAAHKRWHEDTTLILNGERNRYRFAKNECFIRCAVSVQFCDSSKVSYDYSNKIESIMDILVDTGILFDDDRFIVHQLSASTAEAETDGVLVLIDGDTGIYEEVYLDAKGKEVK